MKIIIADQEYSVDIKDSALSESIANMCPFTLALTKSMNHEYYGTLPGVPETTGVAATSSVKAGGIYYFKDWNAFSLNYIDTEIAPYKVYEVGTVKGTFSSDLAGLSSRIEATVEK